MRGNKSTEAQLDIFNVAHIPLIFKIPVQYIEQKNYIFVRSVEPVKPQGAKALKNEDFKDHEYWKNAYAYSRQVTTKLINERYQEWQKELDKRSEKEKKLLQEKMDSEVRQYGYSPTFENMQSQSRSHNYYTSYEMPERLDQYKIQIRYKNYESKNMFIEICFYGPLYYPQLFNHTTDAFIGLNCIIPKQHQISVDMYSNEAVGNSALQYFEGSTFWSLLPGDNELEMSAQEAIGEGTLRIQTRYEMKTPL
jgi:hypothetical protein